MKTLLIGGSGCLGTAVQRVWAGSHEIFAPDSQAWNVFDGDFLRRLRGFAPELVVYAPHHRPVDDSDGELLKTYHLNTRIPLAIAGQLEGTGARLVTFSTDTVFPGRDQPAYTEDDCPAPATFPALTKFGADSVLGGREYCYVIRLSRVFGPSRSAPGVIEKLVGAYKKGESLRLVTDVYKSHTYSIDVARALLDILENYSGGLYHVANAGSASLFDFFQEMSGFFDGGGALSGISRNELDIDRKPNSSLLRSVKVPPLRPWRAALAEYCEEYLKA